MKKLNPLSRTCLILCIIISFSTPLVREGIRYHQRNLYQALIRAVENDDSAAVEAAIRRGADTEFRGPAGSTPLMWAAVNDRRHATQSLIRKGANVNAVTQNGSTALMRACAKGDIVIVNMLLDAGAGANVRAEHGITALGFAEHFKYKRISDRLRQAGAVE